MGTAIYFLKEAVRGFYQAKLMTFVAILSIAASLFFMSCTVIAFLNVERLLSKSTDQADMAAYLYDATLNDSVAVDDLIGRVRELTSVRRVEYIDKESAWKRFAELYGSEMLESVDDNPLPAHLEIYFREDRRSQEDAQRLADVVGSYDEIESVRYSREWIDLVEKFRILFAVVATVIAVVIIFILYFMISNTIKLTIYARKELVTHMQVVGATAFFIEMPFILEGLLQGFIGGILSVLAMGVLRLLVLLFFSFDIYWGPHWLPGFFIFIGVLFGWLGSAGAVRKFIV